jgi:cytosine/uracil/thiamine/allantoin permease
METGHDYRRFPLAAPGAYIAGADDARLTNEDLAPLKKQTWGSYNIFAFWMSDVHSVGGYVFAGSLFALGLTSWQVLISLLSASASSTCCATWWRVPARRMACPIR